MEMNFCISPLVSNGLVVISTLAKFEDKIKASMVEKNQIFFFLTCKTNFSPIHVWTL
jgi:hypothetical protein